MKIFYFKNHFIVVMLITIITFSCEKQNVVNNEINIKNGNIEFALKSENDIICFDSEKDYETAIEYLNTLNLNQLTEFENKIGFKSLKSNYLSDFSQCPINDHVFATLLNTDLKIIVGDYLFEIIPEKEIVNAYSVLKNNTNYSLKSGSKLTFSIEDDVFSMLKSKSTLKAAGCSGMKHYNLNYTSNGQVETILQYQKFGIYFKLKVEIVKNQNSVEGYIYLHETVTWKNNSGKSGIIAAKTALEAPTGVRSGEISFYNGFSKLVKYYAHNVECSWRDTGHPLGEFDGAYAYSDDCGY